MSLPLFLTLALTTIAAALGVVLLRNPVRSALSLVVTLFLLAVIYVFLEAHLVAALQIIVYAGAIMVLFLFVIMLLNLQEEPRDRVRPAIAAGAAAMGGLLVLQLVRLMRPAPGGGEAALPPGYGHTEAVAERLFTQFLLPFEMTSVLLLVAIVGAVVLAKRKPA